MYGISRMFEVLAEKAGVEIGVFRDMDEAIRWLGQDGLVLPDPEEEAPALPAP
jgi:SpoU rRNA methylase family enzyme